MKSNDIKCSSSICTLDLLLRTCERLHYIKNTTKDIARSSHSPNATSRVEAVVVVVCLDVVCALVHTKQTKGKKI